MKKSVIVLIAFILLDTAMAFYMDCQKENFHIDETYSYVLSNSHDADRLSNSELLWRRWFTPEELNEFTTVQEGERFDFAQVYLNNTTDAHPPLYYWCLHTVCSLFPNSFSMWYGLGLNLLFFVLSQVVLYFISRKVINNDWLALLPVILWGLSPIAVDTTMYIRMYSLMTLLNLLSVLIHLKMYQDGQTLKRLALVFLISFLGSMTHYYFVISALCTSAAYVIWKFTKKEYRQMLLYGIIQLSAIILLFVVYPASFSQITGSSTNNVGNEVANTFFSFTGWPNTIYSYLYLMLYGWGLGLLKIKSVTFIVFIVSSLILLAVTLFYNKSRFSFEENASGNLTKVLVYGLISFAVIVIIAKMSYKYVYVRYIYHMIPLYIVVGIMFVEWLTTCFKIPKIIVFSILIAFSLANAIGTLTTQSASYLYKETQSGYDTLLEKHGDIPVVLLSERKNYVMMGNYHLFKNYSNTYIMPAAEVDKIDDILNGKSIDRGIILLIWTDTEWGNGYDGNEIINDVQASLTLFDNYEIIARQNHCDLYYVH